MMSTVHVLTFLLVVLSISLPSRAQENQPCTMPDGVRQSICIRLYNCETFRSIVINSPGGRPSAADGDHIKKHACGASQLVCCPDKAVTPTTTTTTTKAPVQQQGPVELSAGLPPLSNLDVVKNHRNINLINVKCGGSSAERIVGGFEAAPGELPWMALLKYKGRLDDTITFNCGGTLISSFYVLTAAHCVTRDLVGVRLGEHNLTTEKDCDSYNNCLTAQDIDVEKVMKHENYNKQKKINDIALIRLKAAADVTKKNIKPICLPTSPGNQIDTIDEETRNKMLISGWGRTENGRQSNVLLKAYVPFMSNSKCSKRFAVDTNIKVYPTYLCAGGVNKTDTCNGDSGGPIQSFGTVGSKARMVLYGVVSAGIQCLEPEVIYPGIYTNVAYYLTWVLDKMTS